MTAPRQHTARNVALVVVLLALAAGGLWFTRKTTDASAGRKGGERKVPVLVETVEQRDQPIVLEGLGTVTPLATVQVKSQVDGRLQSVAFKEGALVKKGDKVAWNSSQGEVKGVVEKKLTAETHIKGHKVAASPDDPEYLVRSDKTGAEAAHKPEALTRR